MDLSLRRVTPRPKPGFSSMLTGKPTVLLHIPAKKHGGRVDSFITAGFLLTSAALQGTQKAKMVYSTNFVAFSLLMKSKAGCLVCLL